MLLDGYIRVSKVRPRSGASFISPVAQREQIENWAGAHGALIGLVFEELDVSGARSDRPLLLEALRRVESHESDGLIVAYLSRFGRSLIDAMNAIKRISDAGGTFVSVQEGLDLSNDTGRLVLRMLLSIAEWERDRQRAYFGDACQRAIARGVPVGIAPVGYRRGRGGRLEVDPEASPVVVELFRRRSSGERLNVLERWLEGEGQRLGRNWHLRAEAVVSRRVYRGELRYGSFVNVNAHEPLVDEQTWKGAQGIAARLVPRKGARPALLRGLLRCAGCQRPLRVSWHNVGSSRESLSYHCTYESGPSCGDRANIVDTLVEPYLEALFWQELSKLRRHSKRVGSRRLETDLRRREEELVAYRDNPHLELAGLGLPRRAR
jgi:DNA invertase Pin-like site-specific DNA recombinase